VRRREVGAAVVLLAFGLFALTQARGLRLGSLVSPGPGFFPLGLAAALSLVSVGLVVMALRPPAGVAPRSSAPDVAGRLKVIGTLAGLLVYALVLESLGFLLSTFALLLFFLMALQRQRWLVATGSALAASLVTHLVFKVWLGVNLPVGLWGF